MQANILGVNDASGTISSHKLSKGIAMQVHGIFRQNVVKQRMQIRTYITQIEKNDLRLCWCSRYVFFCVHLFEKD